MSKIELNKDGQESEVTTFTDLLLPLPIPELFTYRVPRDLEGKLQRGMRVIVPFGRNKVITAIVANLHQNPPKKYEAKYVLELLDELPTINEQQFKLISWMAEYYLCHPGEVLNAMLPSGLKLSSSSRVQLRPGFQPDSIPLTENEHAVVEMALQREHLSYAEISDITGLKNIYTLLRSLIAKEAIIIFEQVNEKYRPKKAKKVRLAEQFLNAKELENLFEQLSRSNKQTELLLRYLQRVPVLERPMLNDAGIDKKMLMGENGSASAYRTLVDKGFFEEYEVTVSRFGEIEEGESVPRALADFQEEAKQSILKEFEQKDFVLLHGVTGSGKTEIYIDLIKGALDSGMQVLYILPEIALTTQIVKRLQAVFGTSVGVYHSRFSDNERVEVYQRLISGEYNFVVGVRSSIFLPFDNLGLIIVDEEHETSYKQHEPAPRYHARDTALVLARQHGAKVLLGSATPSVESYYNAQKGRWGFVELKKRFADAQMPEIITVDTKREKLKKTMQQDFTSVLFRKLEERLADQRQTILFQNKRGYAHWLNCEECGHIPKCQNCSVSLTYHRYRNELRCHYCGHREKSHSVCVACGSTKMKNVGQGTEKLEEDTQMLFPKARLHRMDLDTTRSKNAYAQIIGDFERGNIDILIGTQMVTKGLDFDSVTLVGIFNTDRSLHFPDFRAVERTFQLLTQVSGRAGRRQHQGEVVIQTADPAHPVFRDVIANDYTGFFEREIIERRQFGYPPFSRMVKFTIKDADQAKAAKSAQALADRLVERLGSRRVLGPEEPMVSKIRNRYLFDIFVKLERPKVDIIKAKKAIASVILDMRTDRNHSSSQFIVDVDPQ